MFAQSIQVPASNCTYTTSFSPNTSGFGAGWNTQPVISNAILQNDLLNRINSICASDFYNQIPAQFAVNSGLGLNSSLPYNYQAALAGNFVNHGHYGVNGVAPHHLGLGMQHFAGIQGSYGLNGSNFGLNNAGFSTVYGGGNTLPVSPMGFQGQGSIVPVSCIDNDTEVCFECICPGVAASNLDICIVQNEIHVRLTNCATVATSGKTAGARTSGQNASAGMCTPLCNLPLPSFCDASKTTARVENGRLLITCPRTSDYVKNITRVKVS